MKKKNIIFTTMLLCAVTIAANAQKGWLLKGNTGTNPDSNFIGTKDVKPLIFKTNKVERMRINSFGSLYLKDPGQDNFYLLYGEKSSKGIGILIQNTSTTNNSPAIHGSSSGTGAAIIGQSSQAGSTGVYGYNSDGYGLKGQSSNSYGLVASSTNYYGMLAMGSTYAGYFISNVFASGGYYAGSDQKLKQNIQDFASAMDIINQLRPKKYDYRQDGNFKLMKLPQGTHYGLIAQDVEKVLPNLVKDTKFETALEASATKPAQDGKNDLQQNTKSETIDFKAVNYTEFIPIMIKGMQEQEQNILKQQELMQEQRELINNQNKKIEELTTLVNQLMQARPLSNTTLSNSKIANTASLQQNAPNPFRQNTIINYSLPENAGKAFINITDMSGKLIKTFTASAKGGGQLMIEGGQLPSGTYNYSLIVNGKLVDTKKMVLIK